MKGKNILITGGAGYIGSHTVQAFLNAGYKVVVLDNLSTGFSAAVPPGAHFIQADIHDIKTVTEILSAHQIDGVIHFAAKIIVPESIAEPIMYYDNNTGGVLALMQACRNSGVKKFVFSSTAAVYGDSKENRVSESSPVMPLNPYGTSKYFSEIILRDCEIAFGLKSVILRYFNVAGAALDGTNGQRSRNATHLIKLACETALGNRESLSITGIDYPTPDGSGVRDYIHVEDLADAHTLAFDYLDGGGNSQILNVGYGQGYSVRDVIASLERVSGVKIKTIEAARRPGDAAMLVANNQKILKVLNWTPKKNDLDLICRSAFSWESFLQRKP